MPRVAKVTREKVLDTREQQVGQQGVVTMDPVVPELDKPDIQVIEGPRAKQKADELAFMEEPVTVKVLESNSESDGALVTIGVNGRNQNFIRGQDITVKRKYVEGLARAKPVGYRNEEYTMEDGTRSFRYPKRQGLRFPFQVIRDDNPRGADWLRKILAEGA